MCPKMNIKAMRALKSAMYLQDYCIETGCSHCCFYNENVRPYQCLLRGSPRIWWKLNEIKIRGYSDKRQAMVIEAWKKIGEKIQRFQDEKAEVMYRYKEGDMQKAEAEAFIERCNKEIQKIQKEYKE